MGFVGRLKRTEPARNVGKTDDGYGADALR